MLNWTLRNKQIKRHSEKDCVLGKWMARGQPWETPCPEQVSVSVLPQRQGECILQVRGFFPVKHNSLEREGGSHSHLGWCISYAKRMWPEHQQHLFSLLSGWKNMKNWKTKKKRNNKNQNQKPDFSIESMACSVRSYIFSRYFHRALPNPVVILIPGLIKTDLMYNQIIQFF